MLLASLLAKRPLLNLGARFLATMTDALKTHEVIPDVIDTIPPAIVKVSYPSGVSVEIGKELTPTQVKDKPNVDWDADSSNFYTLCMTGKIYFCTENNYF